MWSWSSDRGFRGRACRLVSRILYHLNAGLARLAVRSGRARDLEIVVLRHQLAVLARNGSVAFAGQGRGSARKADCPANGPGPSADEESWAYLDGRANRRSEAEQDYPFASSLRWVDGGSVVTPVHAGDGCRGMRWE